MPVAGGARALPRLGQVAALADGLHEGLGVEQRHRLQVGLRALGVLVVATVGEVGEGAAVGRPPPAVAGVAPLGVLDDEAVLGQLA